MSKKLLAMFVCALACALPFPAVALAYLPYETGYYEQNLEDWIGIQPLYVPWKTIAAAEDGQTRLFANPGDLFVAGNDHVYVADSGGDRIVELDADGRFVRTIGDEDGEGRLKSPEGVFVAGDGTVYVADSGNNRVAVFAPDGSFARAHGKPQTHLLPADYLFIPTKLVVDARGVMYVHVKGSYQGLVRLKPDGAFGGFFGANKANLSWTDRLKKAVLSEEQLAKEKAILPGVIGNVAIDPDGFLITVNSDVPAGQIKKLNAAGVDMLGNKSIPFAEQMVDIAVDADGFLYGFSRDSGFLMLFDPTGQVMFAFADMHPNPAQAGVFAFPTSVAVNSRKDVWVADSAANVIQVFSRTAFGSTFFTAASLYYHGRYAESEPYWRSVMEMNEMINLTYQGLGKVELDRGNYERALHYFKLSYDAEGYSETFWSLRLLWLQRYFTVVIVGLIAVWIAVRLARGKLRAAAARIRRLPALAAVGNDLKAAGFAMFHPYEGFYRLKQSRMSYVALAIILLLAAAVQLAHAYGTGFIFRPLELADIDPYRTLLPLFVPLLTWIAANYLVCTVKDGEGRFREVLQGSICALLPYIVLSLPVIALSNAVVLEERIIVDALSRSSWIWLAVLYFVMTQVTHNFDFTETVRNALIIVFTIAVMWLFAFLIAALSYNLWDFFNQIYREVRLHG